MENNDRDFVSFRELVSILDAREARILSQISEKLNEHTDAHKEMARRGISNFQWGITTVLALCATVFAGVTIFHGG